MLQIAEQRSPLINTIHKFFSAYAITTLLPSDKKLHILSDESRDSPSKSGVEDVTPGGESLAPGTPKFTPEGEKSSNNILIYVSVLAAVVLGLLVYVAYKW